MMPDCLFSRSAAARWWQRPLRRLDQNFARCDDRWFVRALLPIPILGGEEVRIGIWVDVEPAAFYRLGMSWNDEAGYMAMRMSGEIENELSLVGRQVRGMTVHLAARSAGDCLFVSAATDPWFARLMQEGVALRYLPQLLHRFTRRSAPQAVTDKVPGAAAAAVSRLRALIRAWRAPR